MQDSRPVCAFKYCLCEPGEATLRLGGTSTDGEIFFCKDAFMVALPIYTDYKAIETTIVPSHAGLYTMPKITDPIPYHLIEKIEAITTALHLRRKLARKLRDDIPNHGHLYWMGRLEGYRLRLISDVEWYFAMWKQVAPKYETMEDSIVECESLVDSLESLVDSVINDKKTS